MMATRVDVLSLGCGWTSQFLQVGLQERGIKHAFTSTASNSPWALQLQEKPYVFKLGSDGWKEAVKALPAADMVVIVFPIKEGSLLDELVAAFEDRHGPTSWLLLGSTGLWRDGHHTSSSPIDSSNARGQVEEQLLATKGLQSAVMNLAGLYGGERKPMNFILKAAPTKDALQQRNTLHLVHGEDVSRAIIEMWQQRKNDRLWGRRWIVSDTNSYDWWHLAANVSGLPPHYPEWSQSFAQEHNLSLPRPRLEAGEDPSPRTLNRTLDGGDFWDAAGVDHKELRREFHKQQNQL